MRRLLLINGGSFEAAPMAIGLFLAISALVALCAKHAARKHGSHAINSKIVPRSPKQLLTVISSKAIPFFYKKNIAAEETKIEGGADEFGEGGLWQREILMGEKCQPPDFSGVIYYDGSGNQVAGLPPRSPRAGPLSTFSFQMNGSR